MGRNPEQCSFTYMLSVSEAYYKLISPADINLSRLQRTMDRAQGNNLKKKKKKKKKKVLLTYFHEIMGI